MAKRAFAMFIVVALTGCQFAERGKRAAFDVLTPFVLDSFYRMQSPLTEGTIQRSKSITPASRGSATPAPASPSCTRVCTRQPAPQKLPIVHKTRLAMLTAAAVPPVRIMRRVVSIRPSAVDLARFNLEARFAALERLDAQRAAVRVRTCAQGERLTIVIATDTL